MVGIVAALGSVLAWRTDSVVPFRAALCAVQAVALLVVARSNLAAGRGWATASFITAAALAALFLIPCVVYTAQPSLYQFDNLSSTIAVVTLGMVSLLAGFSASNRHSAAGPGPTTTFTVSPAR
ncbi:MAG: hypothetical protein AAGC46_10235, partial [Solirubrobacteraceae bacterium]|nr:hypothetical protein [Patulibacter sp.]